MKVKPFLQLCRAQTWPATFLLVITPFLTGECSFIQIVIITVLTWLIHLTSFGHNSLMDFAMMYDQRDPNKTHHPLITGAIKLNTAHNIIHWSLALLSVACAIVTVFFALNPVFAMACLIAWISFGHGYNDGLSKESPWGFISITVSMTAMGLWGWFLSHETLTPLGMLYAYYVLFTILYQISWSGFVKEMQLRERSNILAWMGATLDVTWKGEKKFLPGKSRFYAYLIKGAGLFLAYLLLWLNYNSVTSVITVLLTVGIIILLHQTTKPRIYNRSKELLLMSLMEILTIYLVIPLMLDPVTAAILMLSGIIYFFGLNLLIWRKPYPAV